MSIRLEVKKNIQQFLPYGALSKIKRKLAEKDISVSVSHVRNVLSPYTDKWDANVIAEAQEIVIAIQKSEITAQENIV